MDFFQKNSHVFRISWEKIEGTREKREKQKVRRNIHKGIHSKNKKEEGIYTKASTAKTNPRQKRKERRNIHKGIHDRNQKDSTAKTKRIPHKIGRKEGQFVHKSKDLRSKILMQT